jgi:hypothetical protein
LALMILTVVTVILIWYPFSGLTAGLTGNINYDPRCYLDGYGLCFRFQVTVWLLSYIACLWFIVPSLRAKPPTQEPPEFSSTGSRNNKREQVSDQVEIVQS